MDPHPRTSLDREKVLYWKAYPRIAQSIGRNRDQGCQLWPLPSPTSNTQTPTNEGVSPSLWPTGIGERIGRELKNGIAEAYQFDPLFYHFRAGGHVAAMHSHRPSEVFRSIYTARFLTASRRRVRSAIDRVGIHNPEFFAKWSTVRNPDGTPDYALPYGFVQSPNSRQLCPRHFGRWGPFASAPRQHNRDRLYGRHNSVWARRP